MAHFGSFAVFAEWNPSSFALPNGADIEHAKSDLKDGVLTLVVPKLAEAQAKKIPIATGAKS